MAEQMKQSQGSENSGVIIPESLPEYSGTQKDGSRASTWENGQCVLAVPSSSMIAASFDLSLCRTLLERDGFQIPISDFEAPLEVALGKPSVRRYMFINSSFFHFIFAPVVYLVLWCAVYSSLHLYLPEDVLSLWVLCVCVSLISVIITIGVILLLHRSNKEINLNTDVRLVQVNEKLIRHRLLLGVADWVTQCRGSLQLFCVYWDLSPCLRSLTETLEELSFVRDELQSKFKKRMSHLLLVTDVTSPNLEEESLEEEGPEEERPLLVEESRSGTSVSQREETKLTKTFSLIPKKSLSFQATAYQLLLTYSAVYVKLLVSDKLPGHKQRPLEPRRTHCKTASLCLCQYIEVKVLR
ncbi:transmembrane protein 268 [Chanos chanos]|uniref:Transmembrane protein 268 n=1 Tax=Chanos chanos TaxID=29144 RepID=A0A6J2WIY3_CHACN|nr:transmembrane protein 268 [Chanos chanos]